MSKLTGSWLSGPESVRTGQRGDYRGQQLGLPPSGPGSSASLMRRVVAIIIDWLVVYLPTAVVLGLDGTWLLGGVSTTTLVLWALVGIVSVTLFAQTPGQAAVGIGVARVDEAERVGIWRSVARVVMIFFIAPAIIQDEDGRGLHDRATGTALICTR